MITPKSQSLFIGHHEIQENLLTQMQHQRLHHSYILAGPKGVGKATFAFRVAKYLLSGSTNTETLDVDHNQPVISRIISGGHGDLCYIEPEETIIGVEQIRQMSRFFSQKSMEGGYRIAIIDGLLNRNSANALLKILEEPPAQSLIFLITDSLGKLLPTLRSRCQAIKFGNLSTDETTAVLVSLQLDTTMASLGSPGKALMVDGETYNKFQQTIAAAMDDNLQRINDFCLSCSTESFAPIGEMFLDLIYQHIKSHNEKMAKIGSISQWADTWQEINGLFKQALNSHLDKYQILITSFIKFSPKYRGSQ